MLKVEVINWSGKKVSEVEIKEGFFSEKLNNSLLQEAVKWQLARKRKGTHKVKTRGEVSGGGKKPFRQKGTGNARQGSIRSPLLKGGGVAHGPKPRDYDWALPKKIRRQALKQAISYIFQEKRLVFVENMESPNGKTKELVSRFNNLGWDKALLIDEIKEEKFERACKNLKNFKFLQVAGLNVYDILKFDRVILTPKLLDTIYKRCGEA